MKDKPERPHWIRPADHPPPLHETLLIKPIGGMWYRGKVGSDTDISVIEGWQYPPIWEVKNVP